MHVVLINGPAKAGKNTLAKAMRLELSHRLESQPGLRKLFPEAPRFPITEHKDTLIHMLFAFAASLSFIELTYNPYDEGMYLRLKDKVMLGRTGRQWQIIWADAMRAADSNIFIDSLHHKIRRMEADVAIIPDCGFEDEYHRAVGRFGEDNVTLIYLDGWQHDAPRYAHLDRFRDDIRICLRDFAHLTNISSVHAVSYVLGKIESSRAQLAMDLGDNNR